MQKKKTKTKSFKKEHIENTLIFLSKAKYSNAENIQAVSGRKTKGFARHLVSEGILVHRRVACCTEIYSLSTQGARDAGCEKFDFYRIGLTHVEHTLKTQAETIASIKNYNLIDYYFEPQQFPKDSRPDSVWVMPNENIIHYEQELTKKGNSNGALDRFFKKVLKNKTVVCFVEINILNHYLMAAYRYYKQGIPEWSYDEDRKEWWNTTLRTNYEISCWGDVYFKLYGRNKLYRIIFHFKDPSISSEKLNPRIDLHFKP